MERAARWSNGVGVWAAVIAGALAGAPLPSEAAQVCAASTEVFPDSTFKGQKCTDAGLVVRTGAHTQLADGETLDGSVEARTSKGVTATLKSGAVQGHAFSGYLNHTSTYNKSTGAASAFEDRSGTEDLGAEGGAFVGSTQTQRYNSAVAVSKSGTIQTPNFQGYLNSYSTQDPTTGQLSASASFSGTWVIAGRTFVGDLQVQRSGGEVSVIDNRHEVGSVSGGVGTITVGGL